MVRTIVIQFVPKDVKLTFYQNRMSSFADRHIQFLLIQQVSKRGVLILKKDLVNTVHQ